MAQILSNGGFKPLYYDMRPKADLSALNFSLAYAFKCISQS
jgi:hypothetical protein